MAYRFLGPIFTQMIILYCYFCSMVDMLIWLHPKDHVTHSRSWQAIFHMTIFSIIVFLIQSNYFLSCIKGPGVVPLGWKPPNKKDEKFLQFCSQCQGFKAPRSHHCRRLNRCCLKMDHYCPWIGTTVGHHNQAFFLRFLFFVPIGCTWAVVIILLTSIRQIYTPFKVLYQMNPTYFVAYTSKALIFNFVGFGGAMGTTIAVSFLFYQQLRILLSNKTSIERWICEKARDREESIEEMKDNMPELKKELEKVEGGKNATEPATDSAADPKSFTYPYDLGKINNIKQVIGWHGFKASLCCQGLLDWPVLPNCGQFDLTVEQLSQKALKKALTRKGTIVKNFSGWWLPIFSFGCIAGCFKVPISDENRLPLDRVHSGKILVTRGYGNHWWYGQLVEEKGLPRSKTRGWFPRRCVSLDPITDEDVAEAKKEK